MKRRIFCAVMTVVLVLTMLPVIAAAEGAVEIAFTQRETKAGATQVQVGVDMSNNPGLVTATIPVTWNNDVLHLVNVIPSEDILSAGWIGMGMDEYKSNGTYYLAWDNDLAEADFTTEVGCLAELVFDIVDPSKDTETTLAFDMDDPIANVMNFDMEDLRETVTVNAANGTVSVAAEAGGDNPVVDPQVVFTYNGSEDIIVKPGEGFELEVVLQNVDPASTIAISGYTVGSDIVTYNSNEWLLTGATMAKPGANAVLAYQENVDMNTSVMKLKFTAGVVDENVKEVSTTFTCNVMVRKAGTSENIQLVVDTADIIVRNYIPGDFDGDELVNTEDAIYLLQYTFFPDLFPIDGQDVDYNNDGMVNTEDAIYLLQYTFFPDLFPIE